MNFSKFSKTLKSFLGFLSFILPGAGEAILYHPRQGFAINLMWKLFLLSILLPVVGVKLYVGAALLILLAISLHTIKLTQQVPSPRPVRIGAFILLFLLLEVGEIALVRTQVMKYYRIHDASMQPTLLDGDLVVLNKISSLFDNFQKNDVIIFHHPMIKKTLVKRIAKSTKNKELFVLGDNRNHSLDSRKLGTIPAENVFGKVSRIMWSFDSAQKRIRWERIGLSITSPPYIKDIKKGEKI